MSELTPKQAAFVREYLVDLSQTQAAIRAGYSERTARAIGCDLMKNPEIAAAITEATAKRAERTEARADAVLAELVHIADVDIAQIVNDDGTLKKLSEIPKHVRKAIASIERKADGAVKITLASKIAALELLGRHLKLFTDKIEHSLAASDMRVPVRELTVQQRRERLEILRKRLPEPSTEEGS